MNKMNGIYISERWSYFYKGLGRWLSNEFDFSVLALDSEFLKQDFMSQLVQIRKNLKSFYS